MHDCGIVNVWRSADAHSSSEHDIVANVATTAAYPLFQRKRLSFAVKHVMHALIPMSLFCNRVHPVSRGTEARLLLQSIIPR
jgi:hypothetical protein